MKPGHVSFEPTLKQKSIDIAINYLACSDTPKPKSAEEYCMLIISTAKGIEPMVSDYLET
jgi:hypothetical protein